MEPFPSPFSSVNHACFILIFCLPPFLFSFCLNCLPGSLSVAIKPHTLFIYSFSCCLHPMISWISVTKSRTGTDRDQPLARLRLHDCNVVFLIVCWHSLPGFGDMNPDRHVKSKRGMATFQRVRLNCIRGPVTQTAESPSQQRISDPCKDALFQWPGVQLL